MQTTQQRAGNLTDAEAIDLGKTCRDYNNPLIQAFAAERIGESYPLSAPMAKTVLEVMDDAALGRAFAEWCDKAEDAHVNRN